MTGVVSLVQGQYVLVNNFIGKSAGERLFSIINTKAVWTRQSIKLFGKSVASPRLTAWYGDSNAVYRYSGIVNTPRPWFNELCEIRERVEVYSRQAFNSVLLNLYRDGNDSMGRHSDNEAELGPEPTIASVSLGATRRFILHPQPDNSKTSIKIDLSHGSLLIMSGKSQSDWKHSVPKTNRSVLPRLNMTFRQVYPLSR